MKNNSHNTVATTNRQPYFFASSECFEGGVVLTSSYHCLQKGGLRGYTRSMQHK